MLARCWGTTIRVTVDPIDRILRAAPDEFPESVGAVFGELDTSR